VLGARDGFEPTPELGQRFDDDKIALLAEHTARVLALVLPGELQGTTGIGGASGLYLAHQMELGKRVGVGCGARCAGCGMPAWRGDSSFSLKFPVRECRKRSILFHKVVVPRIV
jgi:hypothetical protein